MSVTDRLTRRLNTTKEERKEGGFTLIELLIVIVVLGILAGIAIFAVNAFQEDATEACTEANARIDETVNAAVAAGGDADSYTVPGSDGCPAPAPTTTTGTGG